MTLPNVGRSARIYWGDESPQPLLAGVKEKGFTMNGEPIDITSDDDAGWRQLLAVAAQKEVEFSVSGVTKDFVLLADWFAGTVSQALTIIFESGAQVSGTFFLSSLQMGGVHNDAQSFDATFMSDGAVTYTPAA
jgi:predicted secreted protein